MLCWVVSVLVGSGTPALAVGKDFYLPGPAIRLTASLTSEVFSRDGRFLTFVDERVEAGYAVERDRIAKGSPPATKAVVRYDVRRGLRKVLYTPQPDEVLMRIEPVGKGGDVLLSTAIGVPQGDLITWRAIYCPEGGEAKTVADGVPARSFQIAASRTERKAFILIAKPGSPASVVFLSENQSVSKTLPESAYQGGFTVRTLTGNPILFLQGEPPDYRLLGTYEMDFATGNAIAAPLPEGTEIEEDPQPLVQYLTEERAESSREQNLTPLRVLLAKDARGPESGPRIVVADGIVGETLVSADGLALVYLTPQGYFLRELVRAEGRRLEELQGTKKS